MFLFVSGPKTDCLHYPKQTSDSDSGGASIVESTSAVSALTADKLLMLTALALYQQKITLRLACIMK